MARIVSEDLKNISIYKLKQWKLLDGLDGNTGYKYGEITWSTNGEQTSVMNYLLHYSHGYPTEYELRYQATATDKSYNPRIEIVRTTCNYGGKRYWFRCPKCSSRSAKLYLYDYRFICRRCLNLTYESSNRSKSYRLLDQVFGTGHVQKYSDHLEKTRRYYYSGKPTKTYTRYLRKAPTLNPYDVELALYGKRKLRILGKYTH
mgnify:CR=1 FL=1